MSAILVLQILLIPLAPLEVTASSVIQINGSCSSNLRTLSHEKLQSHRDGMKQPPPSLDPPFPQVFAAHAGYKQSLPIMLRLVSCACFSTKLTSDAVDGGKDQNGQFAKISLVVGLPTDILDVFDVPVKCNIDNQLTTLLIACFSYIANENFKTQTVGSIIYSTFLMHLL